MKNLYILIILLSISSVGYAQLDSIALGKQHFQDSILIENLNSKVDELESLNSKLSEKLKKSEFQQRINLLSDSVIKLNDSLNLKNEQIAALLSRDQEFSALVDFKANYILRCRYKTNLLVSKKLIDLDVKRIAEEIDEFKLCPDELKSLIDTLEQLKLDKSLYDEVTAYLSQSLYNSETANKLSARLDSRINLTEKSIKQDLSKAKKGLADYKSGIREFQFMIQNIDDDTRIKKFREKNLDTQYRLNEILGNQNFQSSINIIVRTPYLSRLWEEYKRDVVRTPYVDPDSKIKIQSIHL